MPTQRHHLFQIIGLLFHFFHYFRAAQPYDSLGCQGGCGYACRPQNVHMFVILAHKCAYLGTQMRTFCDCGTQIRGMRASLCHDSNVCTKFHGCVCVCLVDVCVCVSCMCVCARCVCWHSWAHPLWFTANTHPHTHTHTHTRTHTHPHTHPRLWFIANTHPHTYPRLWITASTHPHAHPRL